MFTSLRQPQPDPAPAETEDPEAPEPDDDQEQPVGPADEPVAFPRAVAQGVRGWLTWCSNLIGPGWTWTVHVVAVWAAGYYSLPVTVGVILGLVVAVAAFIPRASSHRLAQRIERLTGTAPPGARKTRPAPAADAPAPPPADPLVTLLWELIGDASGVHFKTLCESLAEGARKRGAEAPARAEVEASLEARRIPLRKAVRDAQGRVNRGVHREDLQAARQTPPPAASGVAAPAP